MPMNKRSDEAGGHLRTPTEAELLTSTTNLDDEPRTGVLIDVSRSQIVDDMRSPFEIDISFNQKPVT